jgi:hypothetical protein
MDETWVNQNHCTDYVRVSLDFDILIESFIPLCIMETVGAIFREYKPWIVLLTFDRVYQKTSKALGVSYTSVHRIMNGKRPCKSNRPKERAEFFDDFDHCDVQDQ